MTGAEYRVLGPLQVLSGDTPVVVPAGKGRVLLATLLLRPNRFVSVDELVERLWDGSPPTIGRATKTLHMTVARLRQALGPANCVTTALNGYLAEVENLDLLRFRALADHDPHAALGLWRDPVLANVVSDALHREDVPRLVDERLVVLERRIEEDLDRGRTAELVPELRALTAAHPLRERLWAQLMIALYRSDQQAAALDAFREVSGLLADELGIDPGARLRELHQSILRAEPELNVRRETLVPRQLPPDLARFVGRTDDLAQLDRLLSSGATGQAVVISAIAGSAGVGKTALAVHWAHRVRDRFPDGQLAVNLRGYDRDEPLTPHDALGQLLRGLGLSPREIPDETEERVTVYRSVLADRRVLVLLDNARTAEQVRPMLPAGGRSVVVITSRSDLRGLVALNDAKVLKLGVLPLPDAVRLLRKVIGTDRVDAEPEATAELARLCACLPLALRIAASLLVSEPHLGVRDLVQQLSTGDRLAELEFSDDPEAAVGAAFDLSYAALGEEERRMFRMLGLAPSAGFTPMSAGALMGVPSTVALKLLRGLAKAHLVEELAPQRFSQHDLLRLHARRCAAAEESGDQRRAAVVRFLDHHLHSVDNASRAVKPPRHVSPLTERDPVVEAVEFADGDTALAWCGREHDLLVELCEFALAQEQLEHAWRLPARMWSCLKVHGSTDDYVRLFSIALEAARRLPDKYAEAVALHNLGQTYKRLRRFDESLDLLHQALRIRRERNDHFGMAVNESELGAVHLLRGDHEQAVLHDRRAAEHYRVAGDDVGLATALNNLACDLLDMNDFAEAAKVADEAVDVYLSLGGAPDPPLEDTRAQAKFGMGDLDGAVRIYRGIFSSASLDRLGSFTHVEILLNGAEVLRAAGHRQEALQCARKALTVTTLRKQAGEDEIRQLVRELETD